MHITADKPKEQARPDYVVSLCTIVDNDDAIIEEFLREVSAELSAAYRYFEIVLVDNHSTDGSDLRIGELLSKLPNLRLIRLSRHCGSEIALAALLDHCVGDYVVTMDIRADPVDQIPGIIEALVQGTDVVTGQFRGVVGSWVRRNVSSLGFFIAGKLLGAAVQKNTGYFLGLSRRAVNSITRIRSKSRFIVYDSRLVGFRNTVFGYDRVLRAGAVPRDESALAAGARRTQMVIANSLRPLRMAGIMGLTASALNVLYLCYVLAVALFKRNIAEGWLTTSLTQTVMFFAVFLILSILTEYVGRILEESKDQPIYFVERESSSSVSCYDRNRLNIV